MRLSIRHHPIRQVRRPHWSAGFLPASVLLRTSLLTWAYVAGMSDRNALPYFVPAIADPRSASNTRRDRFAAK
jgi:hypothetical protein